MPSQRKDFYLKFLRNIEDQLRSPRNSEGSMPDGRSVQDLKELWGIVASHYAQEFGEEPPTPFWEAAPEKDKAGS